MSKVHTTSELLKWRPRALPWLLARAMLLCMMTSVMLAAIPICAHAVTTLVPVSYATTSGGDNAQPVASSIDVLDETGTTNNWNEYVQFQSRTAGSAYSGTRNYNLSTSISPSSITNLQVEVNYLGPTPSVQTLTWYIYNWSTSAWVQIGTNASTNGWTQWTVVYFTPTGTLANYVRASDGLIQLKTTSNNTADDANIDYEAVLVTSGGGAAATPTYSPSGGTYSSAQTVTISDTTPGASIYYTTNGTTPTTSSTHYTGPITVASSETVEAIATASGYTSSSVGTAGYTITTPTAAAPTFSPAGGTYSSTQSVTLADTTTGANIYYTTNGTTPTTSSTHYTGAISVASTETIEAIAAASGYNNSSVGSSTYTISSPTAATPTFSPAGGTYTGAQSVTLSDTTTGASIYYTTDGSTPTTSSTHYTAAISVTASETIKAIATATGYASSSVGSAAYTITTGGTAATPTYSPTGGTYSGAQSVTISDTTTGASIYYTTNGTTPTTSSTLYTGPIAVTCSETIESIAAASGYTNSAVGTAGYTITTPTAAAPTFSPAGGSYSSAQSVTLSDSTTGANIYYTTNGTTPTTSSTHYTGAISVTATETIEAIAAASGYNNSSVASATYTISTPTAAAPTFSPAGGSYTSAQSVTLSDTTTGAAIYYTTNGTTPTTSSTHYTGAISVTATETIEAIAVASGYNNSSVASATYTISAAAAATPTFSPAGGTYSSAQSVTLSDTTTGAAIYYTTNGTTPTISSTHYTGAISVASSETIEAIAAATGFSNSSVASATYTIGSGSSTVQTLVPVSYATTSGMDGGEAVATSIDILDESGTQNIYADYLQFQSKAATPVAIYTGTRNYTLPTSTSPSLITAMQVTVNYLGGTTSEQTWTWSIFNYSTNSWVTLGTNAAAAGWGGWSTLNFTVSGTYANYVRASDGSIMLQTVSNNTADNADIDYEAVTVYTGVGVTISPATASVITSTSTQFTATVMGSTNTAVNWLVNGISGGNSTVGTISSTGQYTAPLTVPSPATVTVTAISQADTTKSASASVTISQAVSGSFYVSPTGSDSNAGTIGAPWLTVQHAANTVGPGSTVYLRAGTYGQFDVNVSGSAAGGYIIFTNYPGEAAVVDGGSWNSTGLFEHGLIHIQNQSYIKIVGLEIRNAASTSLTFVPDGVYVRDTSGAMSNIQILNCHIHNISVTATNSSGQGNAHGIAVEGNTTTAATALTNVTISGNELNAMVTGWSETSMVKGNVDTFTVTNNLIHDNNNIGLDMAGGWGNSSNPAVDMARNGYCEGNTVYNCSTKNNPVYNGYSCAGLYVDGGDNIIIERNVSHNNDIGIQVSSERPGCNSNYVTVRSNVIYASNTQGIGMGGYNDTATGGTTNCSFVNNTLYQNDTVKSGKGEVWAAWFCENNLWENNIAYAGPQGLFVNFQVPDTTHNGAVCDYNVYYDATISNAASFWTSMGGLAHVGFTTGWQGAASEDPHSTWGDPLFVSTTTPNFNISAGSPALSTGNNGLGNIMFDPTWASTNTLPTGPVVGTLDNAGNPRTSGSTIDMGAFQD